ncbi:MAG: hypothetical protein AB8H86_27420 [Polyangiales bacterium]
MNRTQVLGGHACPQGVEAVSPKTEERLPLILILRVVELDACQSRSKLQCAMEVSIDGRDLESPLGRRLKAGRIALGARVPTQNRTLSQIISSNAQPDRTSNLMRHPRQATLHPCTR